MKSQNSKILGALLGLALLAQAGEARSDDCWWDPTGWVCAQGTAEEEATNEGQHPKTFRVEVPLEGQQLCPNVVTTGIVETCKLHLSNCKAYAESQVVTFLIQSQCKPKGAPGNWDCTAGQLGQYLAKKNAFENQDNVIIDLAFECAESPLKFSCGNGKLNWGESCDGAARAEGSSPTAICTAQCKLEESIIIPAPKSAKLPGTVSLQPTPELVQVEPVPGVEKVEPLVYEKVCNGFTCLDKPKDKPEGQTEDPGQNPPGTDPLSPAVNGGGCSMGAPSANGASLAWLLGALPLIVRMRRR